MYTVKEILRMQVAPALGCTEPVAIALACAAAVSVLPSGDIERIEIWVDPNIYKNGMAVIIPGTGGLNGLDMAATLGVVAGDANLGLEVLEPVADADVSTSQKLISSGVVHVNLLEEQRGLHIRAVVTRGGHSAEAVVSGVHDNIVSVALDGQAVDTPLVKDSGPQGKQGLEDMEKWLKEQTLSDLISFVDQLDDEDCDFLEEGVNTNMRLAEYGLKHGPGLGIGKTLDRLIRQKLLSRDMVLEAKMLTSAASDARMGGIKLPAMSSAGSGNHGLTAILPIWAIRDYVDCTRLQILEAIAVSHMVTAYIKAHTGRLSAVCGCSVAAGAGAAAGVAYLLGGTVEHISGAIKNVIEDLAGVICDGAKAGCALKLATAASTAVQAALFALQGVDVQCTDGIIGMSPEQTMQNVGTLSTQGMIETDRTILSIMLDKRFKDM